jgi:hypothetical protein
MTSPPSTNFGSGDEADGLAALRDRAMAIFNFRNSSTAQVSPSRGEIPSVI